MNKIQLLIIDDHKIIRDGVKLMTRDDENIDIIGEADSGKKALEFLEKFYDKVNVILMDISIPDINGAELTSQIMKKFPNSKILILTMHSGDNYIQSLIDAGALGYVLKDTGQEELLLAIKTVATGKKYFSNEVSVAMINSLMNKKNDLSHEELTEREKEVLKLIAKGKTNKEAGEILFLSSRTVETHRRNIMAKLELNNMAEMVQYAIKHNMITI